MQERSKEWRDSLRTFRTMAHGATSEDCTSENGETRAKGAGLTGGGRKQCITAYPVSVTMNVADEEGGMRTKHLVINSPEEREEAVAQFCHDEELEDIEAVDAYVVGKIKEAVASTAEAAAVAARETLLAVDVAEVWLDTVHACLEAHEHDGFPLSAARWWVSHLVDGIATPTDGGGTGGMHAGGTGGHSLSFPSCPFELTSSADDVGISPSSSSSPLPTSSSTLSPAFAALCEHMGALIVNPTLSDRLCKTLGLVLVHIHAHCHSHNAPGDQSMARRSAGSGGEEGRGGRRGGGGGGGGEGGEGIGDDSTKTFLGWAVRRIHATMRCEQTIVWGQRLMAAVLQFSYLHFDTLRVSSLHSASSLPIGGVARRSRRRTSLRAGGQFTPDLVHGDGVEICLPLSVISLVCWTVARGSHPSTISQNGGVMQASTILPCVVEHMLLSSGRGIASLMPPVSTWIGWEGGVVLVGSGDGSRRGDASAMRAGSGRRLKLAHRLLWDVYLPRHREEEMIDAAKIMATNLLAAAPGNAPHPTVLSLLRAVVAELRQMGRGKSAAGAAAAIASPTPVVVLSPVMAAFDDIVAAALSSSSPSMASPQESWPAVVDQLVDLANELPSSLELFEPIRVAMGPKVPMVPMVAAADRSAVP